MIIQKWRQYLEAQERRDALLGHSSSTADEQELQAIEKAISAWEVKHKISKIKDRHVPSDRHNH